MKEIKFKVKGMSCRACENLIHRAVKKIEGVEEAKVDYEKETAEIIYDETKTDSDQITKAIEEKGYSLETYKVEEIAEETQKEVKEEKNPSKMKYKYITITLGILILLVGAYLILKNFGGIDLPEPGVTTSFALIFIIGLLTGFHCIAMCGGFVVSYTAKEAQENKVNIKSHLIYGAGKTISYAVIGAFFGLIGSIFTFTPLIRGTVAIIAGIFLMIYGLSMLNIFKWARKLQIRGPKFLSELPEKTKSKNPFVIGLLNGLMIACGPLQAMYIFAAATGSMIQGAMVMLAFGLGTLPVMMGFGIMASLVSKQLTKKILKASAIIVIILGVIMLNRGLALAGQPSLTDIITSQGNANAKQDNINVKEGYQEINMDVTGNGYEPNKFVLKKGVPVKWKINAKELNGCNKEIIVPAYDLNIKLKQGLNVIEFTPDKEGTISWSCWMGMIRGAFIVKEDIGTQEEVQKELKQASVPKGGSCGMASGGGCGCGARV